jgi:nucleoside-diphosphate-sugar epimerase
MTVLLTGATGFVGTRLRKQLGNNCRSVVRGEFEKSNCSVFFVNSINALTNWDGAFDNCKSVVHLAALAHSNLYTDKDYQLVNVEGTLKLASEAAKAGIIRFIFVSSIGVNGSSTTNIPFSDNSEASPHNAYSKSKYDAEEGLKKIAEETGIELVIIRPTLVYGHEAPGNFGALVKLVNKSPILPFGLVRNKRNFIAVQNLVDLIITCIKHPSAAGQIFLASDGQAVSIKYFTNLIAESLGKKVIQLPIPLTLMSAIAHVFGKSKVIEQLIGNLEVDSKYVTQVLGWIPPYTMKESMTFLKDIKK